MTTRIEWLVLAAAACLLAAAVARAQEIVTLPTREGVTQSYLLVAPQAAKPQTAAILFPGSAGLLRLRTEGGEVRFQPGNFLVRARMSFVESGVAVAVMDVPSDEARGMDDRFRLGEKHAADVAAVVADLKKRFANVPVFLVGTSRGSISAASTGAMLGDAVQGVVLTSSVFLWARRGPGLSGFDYARIKVPVLLVHHREDACRETPYGEARKLAEDRRFALISVKGGDPARSDPCEALSAHGYLGREKETVESIVGWILQKPYRENID